MPNVPGHAPGLPIAFEGLEHRALIHDVSVEKYDVFGSAQVAKPLGRGDTGAAVESVYLIPPLEKEP